MVDAVNLVDAEHIDRGSRGRRLSDEERPVPCEMVRSALQSSGGPMG
jgi:hypothetical protein